MSAYENLPLTMPLGVPSSAQSGVMPPDPAAGEDAFDALRFLGERHSVAPRHLHGPGPDLQALHQALALAARAPDHRGLRPWRFVLIPQEQRPALGDLFAADAAQRGHGAEEVERARERALRGAVLLALVVRVQDGAEDVPAHEQWLTAGAALMNFLNGLHLQGHAAKVLSGASVRAEAIHSRFCGQGEQLVAWVVAGTARQQPRPRAPETVPPLTTWGPPAAIDAC